MQKCSAVGQSLGSFSCMHDSGQISELTASRESTLMTNLQQDLLVSLANLIVYQATVKLLVNACLFTVWSSWWMQSLSLTYGCLKLSRKVMRTKLLIYSASSVSCAFDRPILRM